MSARKALLPHITLACVLAASIWVRLVHLGSADLWTDEYFHHFAAQSLARGEGPLLPSGETYGRGLLITRLVAAAQQHVADPELAARLPSALLGVGNVLIFAAIAWRTGGPWAAVVAALLLGTYPGALREARNTRFYTEQLNLGLVALWFCWLGMRGPPRAASESPPRSVAAHWIPLLAAAAIFAVAARVQPSSYTVAAGAGVALTICAGLDWRALGTSALRYSARVQFLLVALVLGAFVLLLRPEFPLALWQTAVHVPPWAAGTYSPLGYYWALRAAFPLLVALSPVIYAVVALQRPRLALLLFCWFAVPLMLHSFVFRFQNERYILLAVPGLLLAAAVAIVSVAGAATRAMERALNAHGMRAQPARRLSLATLTLTALALVATSPSLTYARRVALGSTPDTHSDWRAAGAALRAIPGSDTIPWGSRDALASIFHWGRVDFSIYAGALERQRDGRTEDFYSGVPVLTTPNGIREYYATRGKSAVIIVVDSAYAIDVRGDLMPKLRRSAQDICSGTCGPMHVFLWRFADEGEPGVRQ